MADPELLSIIRQMLDKGMPADQIATTLEEMGIPDAKNLVYGVAGPGQSGASSTPSQSSPASSTPSPRSGSSLFGTSKPAASSSGRSSGDSDSDSPTASASSGASTFSSSEGWTQAPHELPPAADLSKWEQPGKTLTLEEKMDEILALLKALQTVNRRILETDRDVLLRLKK